MGAAITFDSYTMAGFPAENKTSMIVQKQLIEMSLGDFIGDVVFEKVDHYDLFENDDFLKNDRYFDDNMFETINKGERIAS
ncbi:MAG: hypothetical protein PHE67_12925 [Campylobacterales bacterium]|jgi:hypothetical protein|nr:hypothetical protein [Campylobacterales bacterium]MDY0246722.1 hypothetical protein [Methanosarcina mazei]